jgi:two-component system cell cycle sensor histidine kinase/response regulator CckA
MAKAKRTGEQVAVAEMSQPIGRLDGKRHWVLLLLAMVFAGMAFSVDGRLYQISAALVATTLSLLTIFLRFDAALRARLINRADRRIVDIVSRDVAACFLTDSLGQMIYRNEAAVARFGGLNEDALSGLLAEHFASPGAVLYRLQTRALAGNRAREDVVTRHGHSRISAHSTGADRVLWRLEEFQDRTGAGRGAEQLSLPMLTANKRGVVLYSNEAMRRLLGARPKRLDAVFVSPQRHSGEEVEVSTEKGIVRALLAEIEGLGERHEIYLLPISMADRDSHVLADFEHVPVPLAKFAADGLLCGANLVARDLLDLQTEEDVMFHDLFEGLGRPVADWLADIHAERIPGSSEVLRACNLSGDVFFQVTLRRIVELGRPYILAVLQDATQFKRLEEQFVQSQKMQAIGQLAGGVAHDFNNLLTAISGHCDLLLTRHSREHIDYADLMQIHQNANRAAALVGQLLAFSRKQTLKPEIFDIQDVLSDLTHLLNRLVGERARLQLIHDVNLPELRADKRQLEQVIMNIVVNARDAMPDGGTIIIETEAVTLSEPLERDRARVAAGNWAVIRVSDTGIGIPEDQLNKIFEPFYTTKRLGEGTGLGLSTAYGIIKQSGGFIFVDSKLGEGTVFSLYFPLHAQGDIKPNPAQVEPRRNLEARPGEGVVLLVEDEAPVRAFAARALRMRGYTVLEAASAEDALKTLEDPTLKVDIFVTDVVMPGMDGPSWVRQAMLERPEVKVIFVSGYSEESLQEHQARVPNSVFLPKPFSLAELTQTVQGQLH